MVQPLPQGRRVGHPFAVDIAGSNYQRTGDFSDNGAANSGATTATGPSDNTWFHAAGWAASSTSRAAYFNGGAKATDSTSITNPTGINTTDLGVLHAGNTTSQFFNGNPAVGKIWNRVLSDAEIQLDYLDPYAVVVPINWSRWWVNKPVTATAPWGWEPQEREVASGGCRPVPY
jgi:hypothetical protein